MAETGPDFNTQGTTFPSPMMHLVSRMDFFPFTISGCVVTNGKKKKYIYIYIYIFFFFSTGLFKETNRILQHLLSQSVTFFTSGRLNSSVEMASSRDRSTTSEHSFRCLLDCFALWGKQKYNLVAHRIQSDISLWDKGRLRTQGAICFHWIRPFYYPAWNC